MKFLQNICLSIFITIILVKRRKVFLYYLFSRFQRLSNSYFSDATQIIRHWKKPSGNVGWPENCCRIMHCTCSTTFPSLNSFFLLYCILIWFSFSYLNELSFRVFLLYVCNNNQNGNIEMMNLNVISCWDGPKTT